MSVRENEETVGAVNNGTGALSMRSRLSRAIGPRPWAAATSVGLGFLLLIACGGSVPSGTRSGSPAVPSEPSHSEPVVLSIVGTNDLHGRLSRVAVLGGFVTNLRRARADDGAVLLFDAGDLFQGTLESNMNEGASIIAAYNALGYTAATIGNHEFDFGPTGKASVPRGPDDDPQGALRQRLAEASFPFVAANLVEKESRSTPPWPNVVPSVSLVVRGIRVGVVGLTTEETLQTTIAANVRNLDILSPATVLEREAKKLRADGAQVVVALGHLGGKCHDFDTPDPGSCESDQEIMAVLASLPAGLVDVFVAGHTHQRMAHRIGGVAVIESGALGQAFGRVDVLMTGDGSVSDVRIHPPQDLCPNRPKADEPCEPGSYEGAPVVPSPEVVQVAEPFVREAAAKKNELVGITVAEPFPQDGTRESALGNLLADLILEARPGADLAIMNGGGIRAPLPKGELRYQGFFEVFPFDNRFARVRVSAGDLARVFENNVSQDRSILSVSGIRVRARCEGEKVAVDLLDGRGRVISPSRKLTVITSDFIATGGDGGLGGEVTLEDGEPMREALLDRLRERAAPLRPDDPRLLDPKRPRFDVAQRPLPCSASHP